MTDRWLRGDSRRLTVSWPLVLLLAALALTGVAAYQAQDAVRSNRRTAARLISDYGAFGAWTFGQWASVAMHDEAWRVLGPIQHRYVHEDLRIPDASLLGLYFERSFDDSTARRNPPATYFGYMLGADTMKVVGAPLDPAVRRWAQDTIAVESRGRSAVDDPETYLFRRIDGVPWLVAFALMPTRYGPIVYGFALDSAATAAILGDVLDRRTLLPPTLAPGVPNRALMALEVRAPDGSTLFASGAPSGAARSPAVDHLPRDQSALEVRAALRPEIAPRLIIGGLPRSRLPLIGALLVVSLALALVAVAHIRREQALARTRSDFVASVSHELRTPLAQIRLYLETLRLGRFATEEQRDWSLATIDRETQRLAHLVENVLHVARAGRVHGAEPATVVELASEMADAVRAFEGLAASRRTRVEMALEPGLAARVDRGELRQVMLNLLDNAVKYGPAGQTVRVRLERAGDAARLTVDDEGPGVSPAERDAMWEPFQRGSSVDARAVGGSGIGLSVVRDIVERHRGRVRIEDAPSVGARFVIELPLDGDSALGTRHSLGALTPDAVSHAPASA